MLTVHPTVLIPEGRHRQAFSAEAHEALKASILDKGLMHPLVVKEANGFVDTNAYVLIAGERRHRAITDLHAEGKGFFCNGEAVVAGYPCVQLRDLTPFQIREAELEENVLREDLTWQERMAAVNELHELRLEQDPSHTKAATVDELAATGMNRGRASMAVSRATVIAPHLGDEDVAKARDEKEAYSIVARKTEGLFRSQLAKQAPAKSAHRLIHGDLIDELPKLPAESFDVILADPPYGVGADSFGDAAKLEHEYEDTPEAAIIANGAILGSSARLAKPKAHLYLFCDIDLFHLWRDQAEAAGWKPWRTPLIWVKGPSGHAPDAEHGPRRGYECILYAVRGGRRVTELASDVLRFTSIREKDHAAQKPTDLYTDLLRRSCVAGDHVLDPCCGVGTIFAAARELKLIATGIEKSKAMHDLALGRLEEEE